MKKILTTICATYLVFTATANLPSLADAPQVPSPAQCLAKVRELGPTFHESVITSKKTIGAAIPDPAAYEKTLPPLKKVIDSKDQANFKNWAGLSEAYFVDGKDQAKSEAIYKQFSANAPAVLGADNNTAALCAGDLALFYFDDKNYAKAEPLFESSLKQLEKAPSGSIVNNLIAAYWCMAMIKDSQKKTVEAEKYAVKVITLSLKQRDAAGGGDAAPAAAPAAKQ